MTYKNQDQLPRNSIDEERAKRTKEKHRQHKSGHSEYLQIDWNDGCVYDVDCRVGGPKQNSEGHQIGQEPKKSVCNLIIPSDRYERKPVKRKASEANGSLKIRLFDHWLRLQNSYIC